MKFNNRLILILVFTALSVHMLAQEKYVVTAPSGLICRTQPSLSSEQIGTLPLGAVINLVGITGISEPSLNVNDSINGCWWQVELTDYLLLQKLNPEKEFGWECYVYSTYLRPLNRATITTKEIDEASFNLYLTKHAALPKKRESVQDKAQIKYLLADRTTLNENRTDGDYFYFDSLKLANGKSLGLSNTSSDYGIVAYYPKDQILLLDGGHAMDYSINLVTGEPTETTGNPEYIVESPNSKFRLNGYFGGQECSSYFFQEMQNGEPVYLTEYGLGTIADLDICYFEVFRWVDGATFVFSHRDYSSDHETGELRFFQGEIPTSASGSAILTEPKKLSSPFLKTERLSDDYSIGYKEYSPDFYEFGEAYLISAKDTVLLSGLNSDFPMYTSSSPNDKFALFTIRKIRWVHRSEIDSFLIDRVSFAIVDLASASEVWSSSSDYGDYWDADNRLIQDDEVIFDGSDAAQLPHFDRLVQSCIGDLNKDGLNDFAIVTQDTLNDISPYKLEIYFAQPNGDLHLISATTQTIPEQYPNGKGGLLPLYGFSSIYIEKGVLKVEVELHRGSFVHKFRYQNDQFELIGYTLHESDGQGKLYFIDFNLSTGSRITEIEYYSSDEPKEVTKEKVLIRPLPNLSNFEPFGNEDY